MLKSIKQQYIDLREGNMSQANFMRNLRMSLPQYVTNLSSFEDSVKILKNKGILTEADMKNDDKISKYEEYTYTLNGKTVNPEIAFYNNILKAEVDGEIYSIGQPVDNKIELSPIKGKTGTYTESYYADSDPTDGDYDFDTEQRMKAEEYYHKGEQAYLDGDLSRAEKYYQDALKAGSYLSWTEFDLPRYDSTSINESNSLTFQDLESAKAAAKKISNEEGGVAQHVDDNGDGTYSVSDWYDSDKTVASYGLGLNEAKDEKGKWTNTSGKSMYDQFKEIDNLNGHEVAQGIDWEMQCNPGMSKRDIVKKVIKNLKKNQFYYTSWDMSGVEGYEPEYMSKSSKPEDWQMQPLDKNMGNVVDKKMGMQPVKGIEKPKKDSDKGGEVNKTVKGVELMSLIAKTVRGMKKMDATGEKMKKISVKENKVASTIFDKNTNITKGIKAIAKGEDYVSKYNAKAQAADAEQAKKDAEKNKKDTETQLKAAKGDTMDMAISSFPGLKERLKELIRKELKEYEVGDESYELNDLEAAQAVVDNLTPNLEGDTFTESELQNSFTTTEDQMGQRFNDEVFDLAIELLGQDGYTIEGLTDLGELSYGDNMTDVAGHQFD
jgi:hypothetical protein